MLSYDNALCKEIVKKKKDILHTMVVHTLSLELKLHRLIYKTKEIERCKLCGTFQGTFQKVTQRL